ncbi:MAG TPA: heavy metal-binding domain-containing protein [Vicinamibacterales bacterium]|nr:heavy metal-binding domain-containing protein [Vicinamibacterales bacterium]
MINLERSVEKIVVAVVAGIIVTRAGAQGVYMCPMHPDVRGAAGDRCPQCGMALVAAAGDYTPYVLDFSLTPRTLRPKQTTHVEFSVRHPSTGAVVRRFEAVHERVFHLFVVGRDLEYFAHLHPVLRRNGSLGVDVEVPRPGPYELIADFLPDGGAPQMLQRAVVTAGYAGPLNATPALVSDLDDKTDGSVRVHLTPPDPRARREQLLTFELHDPASDAPVVDIEPYLGANGHLLIVSADFGAVFHSHPVAELSSPHGPTVVFQALFPRAGMYRMWAQFQRAGRVATVPFTVRIGDVD